MLELVEKRTDGAITLNKFLVEVSKTQELLKLLASFRSGPGADSVNLGWVHLDVTCGDDETQKRDSGRVELTFLSLYE